jgi:hypothetical protein
VLILDFLHPELDTGERARIMRTLRTSEEDKILEFLKENQIEQLTVNERQEIVAYPTAPMVAMIKSKMKQLGCQSVRNELGRLVVEGRVERSS